MASRAYKIKEHGSFLGKLIARSVRNRPQQKSDRKITFLLSGPCSGAPLARPHSSGPELFLGKNAASKRNPRKRRKNLPKAGSDDLNFDLRFKGDPSIYRYWDAIPCIAFGLKITVMSGHDDDIAEFDGVTTYPIR